MRRAFLIPKAQVFSLPMKKELAMSLSSVLGLCLLLGSAVLLPSTARAALAETPVVMGVNKGVVMELARREHPTNILLPSTDQEKAAVETAYPDGRIANGLNVLLIKRPEAIILVDTGLPATLPALLEQLAAQGVRPEDVDQVIITHAHGDHVGGLTLDGKAVFPKARLVFSAKEHGFWNDPANRSQAPARAGSIFDQWPQMLAPYAGRVDVVDPARPLADGLKLVPAYGHTPGHVGVQLSGPYGAFLFWGDLLHAAAAQIAHPTISTTYDLDPVAAAEARKTLLEQASKNRWVVNGVHMPNTSPMTLPL